MTSTPEQNSCFALYIESDLACANATHNSPSPCLLDACSVETPVHLPPGLCSRLSASATSCCAGRLLSLVLPLSGVHSSQVASTRNALEDPPIMQPLEAQQLSTQERH